MLPPLESAWTQKKVASLLGGIHYSQLGQYARGHFKDSRVVGPLANFQVDKYIWKINFFFNPKITFDAHFFVYSTSKYYIKMDILLSIYYFFLDILLSIIILHQFIFG
jgi:hypothetical protein